MSLHPVGKHTFFIFAMFTPTIPNTLKTPHGAKRLARFPAYFSVIVLALMVPRLSAQDALEANLRLNGMETVKAFSEASEAMRRSVLTMHYSGQRDPFAMATLVAPGVAVAKASDLEGKSPLEARDHRRRVYSVEVQSVDKATDIALLKVDWPEGQPIVWAEQAPQLGTWVVATTPRVGMVRVGLNAAKPRPIESRGATLGVMLQEPAKKQKGCLVSEVFPDSAAAKGGLEKGDVITMANETPILKRDDLIEFLKSHDPGSKIRFQTRRKKKSLTLEVTLDSPSDLLDKMNRNQQMSGFTSRRKDPFSMVLQTDIPVPPEAMGSPLLDIDGKALGILIARADRVTTFSIPKDHVMPLLDPKNATPKAP